MNNNKINMMSLPKWKPLHLMIYFERVNMMNDIIEFAGRSLKKALTIENKKLHSADEFLALKL